MGAFWLYGLWCTVIAFIGGELPVVGHPVEGGLLNGLAWTSVALPILAGISYLISMASVVPIQALMSWLGE